VPVEGAHGVFIDSRGGIWLSTDQALLRFPAGAPLGSTPRRFPLACTGPPVRGAGPGELLVTVRSGLAVIDLGVGDRPGLELVRSGTLAAVAAIPGGAWLAISRGQVVCLERRGATEALGPSPGRARRLLVGRDRTLWILTSDGIWYRGGNRGWRAETALVVAVDASGRTWIGTEHGPIGPASRPGLPIGPAALPSVRASSMAGAALRALDDELGVPPCRPPLNPLPMVRLVVGAGRGSTREVELPEPYEQAGLATWFYAELWLSWSFGPVDPTECVARLESAADLRDERRRRVTGLVEAWRRAAAVEARARSLTEAIEARTERDRLAELIRIASGIDPQEEER
jgi:hypothetical protein